MKYLSEEMIKNKKVLLRCDFNVPVKDGNICDDSKIKKSLKAINYLLDNNNIVIILSHFGRVKKEEDKKNNSLKIVYEYLKKIIDLDFISDPEDLSLINNSPKKCFLVENTRFSDIPNKKESANDLNLASYWSNFAQVFVIDAFASLHRLHSSTAGISKYLPTYLGFLVEEEIKNLNDLVFNPKRPFVVIMGGSKVDDKVQLIAKIIKRCDQLILTGGILNTYLKLKGFNIGQSLITTDKEALTNFEKITEEYENKIVYNNCFIVKRNESVIEVKNNEIQDNDIILDNIVDNSSVLLNAKTIFLNGTCGKYEEEDFNKGTKKLLQMLGKCEGNVYAGGGDTAASINKFDCAENFTFISSGGGATLEYVAYQKLPALEYIKENNK